MEPGKKLLTLLLAVLATGPRSIDGHGRLIEPPSRASMSRYGFNNPVDTDDTACYCGGYYAQWEVNGGKCGVCGDRYDGPRDHEAGGKYANGIIVRHYQQGQTIRVAVELTTSHFGYFEFRICPHNNPAVPVTQDCLDRHLLSQPDGSTRLTIDSPASGVRHVELVLPSQLTCSQCVLQWKYVAGNFWGCDGVGPQQKCCLGCGHQEHYYACADVDVTSSSGNGGLQNLLTAARTTNNPGINILNPNAPGNNYLHQNTPIPAQTPSRPLVAQTVTVSQSAQVTPMNFIHNPNEQVVAVNPYIAQCRGLVDSMTGYCRRTCAAGSCFSLYCNAACQLLTALSDEPE